MLRVFFVYRLFDKSATTSSIEVDCYLIGNSDDQSMPTSKELVEIILLLRPLQDVLWNTGKIKSRILRQNH
jgi:hypothetical protein